MGLSRSAQLGIIACPGGEEFTKELLPQLKTIYRKRFDKVASVLSKKYNLPKDQVIQRLNFNSDSNLSMIRQDQRTDKLNAPNFRIPVKHTKFANGEFKAEIESSIRGMDIYIIQDVENHYPVTIGDASEATVLSVNDHLMSLFVTIDAAKAAGANTVTVVVPAFPYSRQHKRKGREGLTASWFGRVCEYAGVNRILTLDIHSREIENTFHHLGLENLHASYQITRRLLRLFPYKETDFVVVSPDTGAVDRNKYFASNLKRPLALLYKERDYSKVSQDADSSNITAMRLLGDVEGKDVFMADDMLGTGGTLIKAMIYLKELGAQRIICSVSLPLFTGEAVKHFDRAYEEGLFYRIIGTNAVYHSEEVLSREWYECVSISNLFARIISRLHHGRSLSPLLENSKIIQRLIKS